MNHKAHTLLCWLSLLLLLAAACRQEPNASQTRMPTPTNTSQVASATATPALPDATDTPQATETPTPSATPTALPGHIIFEDQTLEVGQSLQIEEVVIPEAGWLVIRNNGGELLGTLLLAAGTHQNLTITVSLTAVESPLQAALYLDGGVAGEFEGGDADQPMQIGGDAVVVEAEVTVDIVLPFLIVSDQQIFEDGQVLLDQVTIDRPAWLIIANAASPEEPLGTALIEAGDTMDLTLHIPWRKAGPNLVAFLAEDAGATGMYEPEGEDQPITFDGQPVQVMFRAILPPDVTIFNQEIVDNTIAIERVVATEPSWLVFRQEIDGELGNVVGQVLLEPGFNERLRAPIAGSAISDTIIVVFHMDDGQSGVFEFPGGDGLMPFFNEDGFRYFPRFLFNLNSGPYVAGENQPVTDTVIVPYVMATSTGWLVIRSEEDGEPGEVIGQVLLEAGFHWDVEVAVEEDAVTGTLYAGLHHDNGELEAFEFPDQDPPQTFSGQPILISFQVEDSD